MALKQQHTVYGKWNNGGLKPHGLLVRSNCKKTRTATNKQQTKEQKWHSRTGLLNDMFLLMLCHCVIGRRPGEMMNCLASRESPIQLLVYQINAWFQTNIAGNRSNKVISIAYVITLTVPNFLSAPRIPHDWEMF